MKASNKHKEQTIASEQYCPTLSEEYQELFRRLTKRLKDTLPMNRARIIGDELRRAFEAAEENDLECKKYMAALSVLADLSLQGWIFDFQDNQLVLKMENDSIYYLVRDRLQPFHPIIGIFALGNPVLNLTVRDDDIGWTVEAIKTEMSQRVHTEYCEQTLGGTDGRTVKVKIQTPAETEEDYLARRRAYADRLFPLLIKNIEGYKSDLFIRDTNTIIEIKSVLSTEKCARFSTVFSERSLKQLEKLRFAK